ncbi:MAG: RHS repeat-associated core domain-containing protein [Allomuricauda sp.]
MQLQRAKLLIFTGLLFLISISFLHAQSASINGPTPSGTINVGDTRTFTLSVTGVQSIVNINWGSSSNYTVVSGQGTTSAQIKFLTVGSVLVNAQVTTLPSFQNFYPSKTVQVNGSVVGQVSITSGITSRCKGGGTSDYNASASNANSYSWSLSPSSAGTINSSTGLVSWNSSYPSSGTSIATVSVTAYGDNNSSSTASRSVTVQSQPSAPPPLSATDSSICSGESSTLSIAGSVLGLQYTLYRNGTSVGTQTSTQFGQQLSWTVSTGGSYYVISTDPNNSCGSSPAGNTVTITSQQGLGTNIVLNNEGSSTRCQGTGTTDFNVTGGSNSNTYQWSVTGSGNTISGSGRNATVNWSSGFGGTTATISAVITSQCGTSTTRTRTVTVDSAVSAPPPLSAADTSICSGETTTLSIAGSVLGLQYTLFRNGTSVGTQTSTQFGQQLSWTVSTAGNYHVTANDPGDTCGSGPAGNTVTLTTQQGLGTNIVLNNEGSSTRCQGTGTTDFNVTGGSNSNTYQWSVTGSGNTISGSGRNATVNWSASYGNSTATISVLITSECGATTTPTSSVFVNPLPSGPPPLSASSETFCSGGSTTLSLAGSAKDVSYALYRGTTLVGTQTSQEFGEQLTWTVSTAGDYYVIIPDQGNSCGSGPAGNTVNISQITPTTLQINTTPSDLSNICAGTPITLTVNGTNATWNGGERANSIVVTPIAGGPTTYTVTANEENCGQLQNASITITPQTPLMWYSDTDGDGLGDRFGSPVLSCSSPGSGWVSNNDDFCPDNSGLANNSGCPPGLLPENLNWTTSKAYDIDGTLKASSKSYYNDLGKLEQTQSVEIDSNRTWASQVVFDSHGRAAVQSLSAPNGLQGTFQFQPNFMQNNTGQAYSLTDFSNTAQDPGTVGQNLNTLGWYYSTANDDDFYPGNDYQDITEYPFSRTIYSTLNPGSVLKAVGGNKVDIDGDGTVDTWPQNYSFSMPATDELSLSVAFGDNVYQNILTTKTVSRDVHGNENVVFTDSEGKVLAAARSGGTNISNYMNHFIGEQAYVDIHVPQGLSGITSSNGSALRIFDMITETLYTGTLGALPSGFYRVAVIDPDNYTPGSISVGYRVNYYDYSLNEYDKADRLVKSYQPLGDTKASKPVTSYDYNALGQLTHKDSPDEGEVWFKYREDGQIRFSQNSKQKDPNEDGNFADAEFSYTEYDSFGRPIESGVLVSTGFDLANPDTTLPSGTKKEQQFTTYDIADDTTLATALGSRSNDYPSQSFVAGNVAHTANAISETWYAYDVYGRVKWLVQNIQGLGAKTLDYTYHPTTGVVTEVIFQKNVSGEQFIHRYGYDIKDRLSTVETSSDGGNTFTLQAEYSYYESGGLKRMDLANGAQGVDYVYNLAGQLKSINHPGLNANDDPGSDADDLFGMQLDYHKNDFERGLSNIGQTTYGTDQFNGNIKGVRWSNGYNTGTTEYIYSYDRNNWLTAADFNPSNQTGSLPELLPLSGNITGDQAAAGSITITPDATITEGTLRIDPSGAGFSAGDYDVTNITYDANGNIQSLKRNKGSQDGDNAMDDLSYDYNRIDPQDGPNQLLQVIDAEGDVAGANDDIGTQGANNYIYNEIGQLTRNIAEDIDYSYNTSGLVTEVRQNGQPMAKFFYNDRNYRIKKETYTGGVLQYSTYYVRDIYGQTIGIYDDFSGSVELKEQPIYGNSRVGVAYTLSNEVDERNYVYELTDHLGNVRVVFAKSGNSVNGESYTDYYPFGMQMPARGLLGPQGYRYAFQGQEKDPETGKEAFKLRLWDARIGRWLTADPYSEFVSPYLGMGNNPISLTDPDGGCVKCDPDAPEGSTFTDEAGFNHTKGADGWVRTDGFEVVVTPRTGWNYKQVTSNTLVASRYNGSIVESRYEFIYPRDRGSWGKPGSDGLIWIGCLSCHSDRGAYTYAAYNSAERYRGLAIAATFDEFFGAVIINPSTSRIVATGEDHHLLGNKITNAIDNHPNLKGSFDYSRTNRRYIYPALDAEAHRGYQKWHRDYDDIVVRWINDTPAADVKMLEEYIHKLHQQSWLKSRIPNVNLLD